MEYFDFQDLDEYECAQSFLDVVNFYNNTDLDWRTTPNMYGDDTIRLFKLIEEGFDKAWHCGR